MSVREATTVVPLTLIIIMLRERIRKRKTSKEDIDMNEQVTIFVGCDAALDLIVKNSEIGF